MRHLAYLSEENMLWCAPKVNQFPNFERIEQFNRARDFFGIGNISWF